MWHKMSPTASSVYQSILNLENANYDKAVNRSENLIQSIMKERGERGERQKNKGCKQTEVNDLIFVPQIEFEKEK